MPDITMCDGTGCERRNACYRFTAIPSPQRQSYFVEAPFKLTANSDFSCEHFWLVSSPNTKKHRNKMKPVITVYADGASSGKSNQPGGWGCVLLLDDRVLTKASGGDLSTTNNRMELEAAIAGIQLAQKHYPDHDIILYSDSAYVIDSMKHDRPWSWSIANWKTSTGSDVKNKDLWIKMMSALKRELNVEWRHVKGHSGNVYNEECDRLAKEAKESIKESLGGHSIDLVQALDK